VCLACRRCAYYALSWGNDRGQLRRGLDLAKKVQQAIVNGERSGPAATCSALPPAAAPFTLRQACWVCRPPQPSLGHPNPRSPADGGAVIIQRQYHNFKQFRIFDLSDVKMSSQHLVVRRPALAAAALLGVQGPAP
jgi:hypothetical protein